MAVVVAAAGVATMAGHEAWEDVGLSRPVMKRLYNLSEFWTHGPSSQLKRGSMNPVSPKVMRSNGICLSRESSCSKPLRVHSGTCLLDFF